MEAWTNLKLRFAAVDVGDGHVGDDGGEEGGLDGHGHGVEQVAAALEDLENGQSRINNIRGTA